MPKTNRIVESALPLNRLCLPLASTDKNSVWIMGEKGVGKSSLVDAMLRARAQKRLTQRFLSKNFYLFDGNEFFVTPSSNKLPQMFRETIDYVSRLDGIIIFDNFDDFVQMAKTDAGCFVGTLVSALEKNSSFQAIILSEHDRKSMIEAASTGIGRRFVELNLVRKPNAEELKSILLAHFVRLEALHEVNFTESAADEIIRLLARFPGQAFSGASPANAIAFADCVAAHVRMTRFAEPPELKALSDKIGRAYDEKVILASDGEPSLSSLENVIARLTSLEKEYNHQKETWNGLVKPIMDANERHSRVSVIYEKLQAKGAMRTPEENDAYSRIRGEENVNR